MGKAGLQIPDIKKITKLILGKKWAIASQLLSEFTSPIRFEIDEVGSQIPFTTVEWSIREAGISSIRFNKMMPKDRLQFFVTRLIFLLPLLKDFHQSLYYKKGSAIINLDDSADAPGISFCSNRSDSILIPDTDFLQSRGYASSRKHFRRHCIPWGSRLPLVFWRGSTTGARVDGSWESLPRLNLCRIANQEAIKNKFDIGVSSAAQITRMEEKEIREAGYFKSFFPILSSNQYRYQIDIDGNTNAWAALFQKLLSGSVVLKVDSPHGFRQWYYDDLIPWEHFIPIKSDMTDLSEKVEWAFHHENEAKAIGTRGSDLAYRLSYEREHDRALLNIRGALS